MSRVLPGTILTDWLMLRRLQLKAIENLTGTVFLDTIRSILHKIGGEAFYHGNVDLSDAKRVQELICSGLMKGEHGGGLPRKKYPPELVLRIPPSSSTLHCLAKDSNQSNTALEVYFQVGKDCTEDRVMVDFLVELMYEPFYDQVRAKDQFGYELSCDSRWTNGVIGMHFTLVTSSKTPQEAEDRIEKFILDYRETLATMDIEDFNKHLYSLAKQKLEMFDSLSDETAHYWSEIRDGRCLWESDREEVLCLHGVTREKTLAAYDKWLHPDSKSRRRVCVQVISSKGVSSEGRPSIGGSGSGESTVSDYNDNRVKDFHKNHCKNQTFGRIY